MAKEIRLLSANEIECRVGQTGKAQSGKAWCSLLLYKDARCDQKILDEVFGMFGWKRRHEEIKGQLCCVVSIKNETTGEWIDKEDVGVESNTEAVKGSFSDSFKRACFNIGIGRELYTAPHIFITLEEEEWSMDERTRKPKLYSKTVFDVREIEYDENRVIKKLVIVDGSGKVRYQMGNGTTTHVNTTNASPSDALLALKEQIDKAQTEAECKAIWDGNVALQKDAKFISLIQNRLKEIG